ncbi:hypothetical protein [Marinisporobacter balticus]|uniref:DUF5673 domain-containing protein n=1 Tax=Marinisporobacter balticus TaxID=2018667 RepID=A0A4R2K7N7_9FIRM|nr:hypothetical protein [Marinisporobacter balticus]TCO68052.1 hypothetical protein EV214_1502 [Marinisporobacter balticus]
MPDYIIIIYLICIALIVICEVRKRRKKGAVIVTCLHILNYDLVYSFIWLVLSLGMFSLFLDDFFDYYSFFVPKYLNKWYYMFSYEYIVEIENQLLQNENKMWFELCKIAFYKSELQNLYISMLWITSFGMFFYRGIQKSEVCTNGIWLRMHMYKWERIKAYKWITDSNKQNQKGHIRSYKLVLYIMNGKIDKKLLNQDTNEKVIKVKSIDKDIVDRILEEKNIIMKS